MLAARIRRQGPLRFDQYVDVALYEPELGFYTRPARKPSAGSDSRASGAGRRRDFLTSPEVGPLFGAVLARALDRYWDELARPDPFWVIDAGAGPGSLCRAVLDASPRCAVVLRYVLVERSPSLREQHREHLPIVPPAEAFAPVPGTDDDDVEPAHSPSGPIVVSLDELPPGRLDGVIVANELLDNLPFRVIDDGREVYVGMDEQERFVEILVAAELDDADARRHGRWPLQETAGVWVRDALTRLARGRLLVIDYTATTDELAARDPRDWLRTYAGHERAGSPLDAPGSCDITADVAVDQLERVASPTSILRQAEFLARNGIDELVAEGKRVWEARAHLGDLGALRARSRVREAEALCDPEGLGGFSVIEWRVGSRR